MLKLSINNLFFDRKNRIIVLEKGEIAEMDSTRSLLDNPNSILSSMVRSAGVVKSRLDDLLDLNSIF